MDWLDYREKLGIGYNDEQKIQLFYVKLFNILDTDSIETRMQINNDEYYRFCNVTGTQYSSFYSQGSGYNFIMQVLHRHTTDFREFISYYIAFLNCQEDNDYKHFKREDFKNMFVNLLTESHIPHELIEDSEGYFVFPKGVQEMDKALVSQPLTWLSKYPSAEKAWIKALKRYADSPASDASDVADLFRKALEAFFQEFFQNTKSLENNKSEYGDYLRSKGITKEISGNFETLLQSYTNYINNYAKHRDATSDKVLEYIMYQTGNIIRLLISL